MKQLYENGTILTMEGDSVAEAVLVDNGRICWVGAKQQMPKDSDIKHIDLRGATLLPGFIDAHSHFAATANAMLQVPLEECSDFEEIIQCVQTFIREQQIPAGQWVTAKGYDHNHLTEKQHPGLAVLDRAAPNHPLVIQHQSGHVGVFNTMALEQLHVTTETPVPEGGKIEHQNGVLTGYMEEAAYLKYVKQVPMPRPEALFDALQRAQKKYASYGITTAQEGMMVEQLGPLYRALLDADALWLDVVGYMEIASADKLLADFSKHLGMYHKHFKIGGYKTFLDGSPQSRTAWMRTAYQNSDDDCGYGTLTDEQLASHFRIALQNQLQLLAHCNGDAACAQYLKIARKMQREYGNLAAIRPVMIHAQLLGIDQLDAVRELSVIPSFFVAHVYHWGDVHIHNFGRARAEQISPAGSALEKGILFTFHQDSPVIEPNMLETVWCAVNRRTKSGELLGAEQCISVMEALRAVTIHAAYQYFEEHEKGSVAVGKRADFTILDRNPLVVDPIRLREIRVLQTIKDGRTIYRAEVETPSDL